MNRKGQWYQFLFLQEPLCTPITTPSSPMSNQRPGLIGSTLCIDLLVQALRNLPELQVWAACFSVQHVWVVTPSACIQHRVHPAPVLAGPRFCRLCLAVSGPHCAALPLAALSHSLQTSALLSLDSGMPFASFSALAIFVPVWVVFLPQWPPHTLCPSPSGPAAVVS